MDITILRMLEEEPLWGYKMMSMLKERHGIKVGPPVMYPLLELMVADGLIKSEETYMGKRRRKVYSATMKGLKQLDCLKIILSEMFEESK